MASQAATTNLPVSMAMPAHFPITTTPVSRIVYEEGMGRLEIFPLPTSETFLCTLLKDLFEKYWEEIEFGQLIPGSVIEGKTDSQPKKIVLSDGYLTIVFSNWHLHLCIGISKGIGCTPISPADAERRKTARAEMYRHLDDQGRPVCWGLRLITGEGLQQLTVFLPNPLLTSTMEYANPPDWSKLRLWKHLRQAYLNLGPDPEDEGAPIFVHT